MQTESVKRDMELREFLAKFGSQLGEKTLKNLSVVYDPLSADSVSLTEEFDRRIRNLLRRPFPVQEEIIKGIAVGLYRKGRERLFVCGEMGTGKTTIALSAAAVSPKPLRTLVVCPTHLVEKWIREAKQVIPGVHTCDLAVRNAVSVLETFRKARGHPSVHEVYVISKERAKLGYGWRPAVLLKRGNPHCPECDTRAMTDDYYLTLGQLEKKKYKCSSCNGPLWQADGKLRRFAPAVFIKKYLKGFFDLVVLDEVHDYKAGNSLQGLAMGALLSAARMSLCLTGTLNGGYADDIFYLLFRLEPEELKKAGFNYNEATKWLETYGTLETVVKLDEEDNYYGRGKKKGQMTRKRPGVSPVVIGEYLLDKSCFLRLADVIEGLPPYEENVVTVPLKEGEHKKGYKELEDDLKRAIKACGTRSLAAMLQALLSYPDSCTLYPERIDIRDKTGQIADMITAPALALGPGELLPKETELVNLVKREKADGRKVLCYLTFTGTRDIRPRLQKILGDAGFRVKSLDASVEPKKREAWIAKNTSDADVLLVNAELVKTGLDLYEFPTVVFYQVGYNVFTLRQAARRSWRIGQTRPVRVYFFCYGKTMQEMALTLVAKKLEVALMVEGDIPEGLAEYTSTGESVIEEMGKALAEGGNYAGAEAAWASFRKKEIEGQLSMNGDEVAFTEKSGKKIGKPEQVTKTSVSEDIVVKVTFLADRKGRKQSVMEVAHGDLEKALAGKTAQFALF